MLLVVGGGRGDQLPAAGAATGRSNAKRVAILKDLAMSSAMLVAAVEEIPNQPLFNGKVEDEIIAHTLGQYFQSGDEHLPALVPMVTGVVRAMDAIEEFAAQDWHRQVAGFTLTGASKRAWTSWLTAAVDHRVKAIVPMVFDMLNIPVQLQHQRDVWGAHSEQLKDYEGLMELLPTPRGDALLRLIDPFRYRDRLQLPKLLVLATNDRYWPADAARIYFSDLKGPTYAVYVANGGHDSEDSPVVRQDRVALALAAAGKLALPRASFTWGEPDAGGAGTAHLRFASNVKPTALTAVTAEAPSVDLREARWVSRSLDLGLAADLSVALPGQGAIGVYMEARFDLDGHILTIASPIRVFTAAVPRTDAAVPPTPKP